MIILICGGSGCGKSSYAENKIMELARVKGERIYYLATMEVYGEEGKKKVERHRKMRFDKGMVTLEQTRNISACIPKMEEKARAVLLEDLGNLVANEMFSDLSTGEDPVCGRSWEIVVTKILEQIRVLEREVGHLLIVTNNVFEDGVTYEAGTKNYLMALGRLNEELARTASEVVEMVVGIPLKIKGDA